MGEFGILPHAVNVPGDDPRPVPTWWSHADSFGLARCNILFRRALTVAESEAKGDERSRALLGVNFKELRRRTSGRPICELATLLRHLNEELRELPLERRRKIAWDYIKKTVG